MEEAEKRKITIVDIAREANVSPALVSRVISGKGSVSIQKRLKVEEIIKKYNFRPNAIARSLQKGHTRTIGFIVPNVGNEYFSSMYYHFEKAAAQHDYLTILCNGKGNYELESRILKTLEETRVEGLVMLGGRIDANDLEERYKEEVRKMNRIIPCVVGGIRTDAFGCAGVYTDDRIGTKMLFEHLKEQGCRQMALIGGLDSIYPSYMRRIQYEKAAKEYGIEFKSELRMESSYDFENGISCMKELMRHPVLPDVICCMNDQIAAGALRQALKAGIRIPEDVVIVGYDGTDISEQAEIGITTLAHDFDRIGSQMFHTIDAMICGEPYETLCLIPPKLIIRESSMRKEKIK